MSLYQHNTTGEVRDIDDARISAWVAAGNPKAALWQAYTPPPPPEPLPPEVPWAISNADLRRALAAIGVNPQLITDYLNSLPDGPAKWTALADWEYANYFERSNAMLDQLAPAFGLTHEAVDSMFLSKAPYPRQG